MAKLNVTYPAVNVLVDGIEYRKVDRKAQAGDIVKARVDREGIDAGSFYAVFADEDGDAAFKDNDGDERVYQLSDCAEDYEVYEPVTQTQPSAPSANEITFEGVTFRKVDRDARVGDVIVITKLVADYFEEDVTVGKPYTVTRIDFAGDPQITDNDGDEYDTDGDSFDVYEKVTESPDQYAQQYREVKRWAEKGDRIRIINREPDECDYEQGAEFIVNDTDGDGDVRVDVGWTDRKLVLLREYVVLEPANTYVHNGATYRKESRIANVGELVLVVANTMRGNEHGYKLGEVTEIVGTWAAGSYEQQRKGSGKSSPYLATADYVVLVPEKPKRLSVGDYFKVVREGGAHNYGVGSVVKVTGVHDTELFYAEKPDGSLGNMLALKQVEPATEAEFLAQKKAAEYEAATAPKDPLDAFAKGDKVRLISGGREFPLYGFEDGSVYEVSLPKFEHSRGPLVEIKRTHGTGYAKADQLEKLTAEEAESIEKERAETEAKRREEQNWANIDRKVGEFKRGDIVEANRSLGSDERIYGAVEDEPGTQSDGKRLMGLRLPTGSYYAVYVEGATLIVPVEERFDKEEAA